MRQWRGSRGIRVNWLVLSASTLPLPPPTPEVDGGEAQAAQLTRPILQQRCLEGAVQAPWEKLLGGCALHNREGQMTKLVSSGGCSTWADAHRQAMDGAKASNLQGATAARRLSVQVSVTAGQTLHDAGAPPTSSVLFSGSSCSMVSHAWGKGSVSMNAKF